MAFALQSNKLNPRNNINELILNIRKKILKSIFLLKILFIIFLNYNKTKNTFFFHKTYKGTLNRLKMKIKVSFKY